MKVKLNEEIKEYCRILKLNGIGNGFEEVMNEASDYEEFLHKLLEREIEAKDRRAMECRIRNARFPYKKYMEDLELD